ncbi:MAG: serine/threonine protein phosphatase PrpC [Planctomycetaceae bacterium]|jgi:serine/threonine protein phosphatase PrpC
MDNLTVAFEASTSWLSLCAAGCSQRGISRANNEDAIHVSPGLELLIVADGVGGQRAGELASNTAIREIIEQAAHWPLDSDDNRFRQLIDQALHRASRVISELIDIDDEFWGAGTTMTLAFRHDDHLFIANVGDSRAYRLRDGSLEQLTVDDSWVELLIRAGSITREQAKTHPQRNVIMTSLGGRDFEEQSVQVGVMGLLPGDRFMISSDGIHDTLDDEEIASILKSDEAVEVVASQLIDTAVRAGSSDDVSVVVLDVSRTERPRQPAESVIARVLNQVRRIFTQNDEPALAES